ncbi:hypothetical protein [Streptomyces sp. NPDC053367]|uniref:hypothetical protein n=1 Tax=Streptomyces sp. NPDC053367 TaxID=3365700 RepID=UPI0037CFF4D2
MCDEDINPGGRPRAELWRQLGLTIRLALDNPRQAAALVVLVIVLFGGLYYVPLPSVVQVQVLIQYIQFT